MKRFEFEVGKEYRCVGVYGGEHVIKIVGRTPKEIMYVFPEGERTDDDINIRVEEIEIQNCTIYDYDFNEIDTAETESILAWTYHSPYAKAGEVDKGYFLAEELNQFYDPEEWEAKRTV